MTNGETLIVQVAIKPISTLTKPLRSVDVHTKEPQAAHKERTDSTVVPAAGVVGEAMLALTLARAYREKFGGDHIDDVRAAIDAYRASTADRVSGPESASIVFVGFMGAGKSSAARAAARVLGADYVDTDDLIAAEIPGGSIAGFFREHGEDGFRELEERIVARGARTAGRGRRPRRRRGRERAGPRSARRPRHRLVPGRGAGRLGALPAAPTGRWRATATASSAATAPACRSTRSARGPSSRRRRADRRRRRAVARPAPRRPRRAHVLVAIAVGRAVRRWSDPAATKLLDEGPAALRPGTRLFGLADRDAFAAVGELIPAVEGDGPIEVAGGEQSKSLAAADSLLRELARTGVRRDDALCAFGGGVAGDLVGFCAAVYQRGVPVVQVPTTLVAQVDSAYGGKTGVDLPEGKNYVGAFHQPAVVLTDPAALATLPAAELAAGFAEVVKTALIAGGQLWDRVRALIAIDAGTVAAARLRLRADEARRRRRRRARRPACGRCSTSATPSAMAIEAASGYSPLSPRRGDLDRARRGAPSLRRRRARDRGRAPCSSAPGCRSSSTRGSTPTRSSTRSGATRSGRPRGSAS